MTLYRRRNKGGTMEAIDLIQRAYLGKLKDKIVNDVFIETGWLDTDLRAYGITKCKALSNRTYYAVCVAKIKLTDNDRHYAVADINFNRLFKTKKGTMAYIESITIRRKDGKRRK